MWGKGRGSGPGAAQRPLMTTREGHGGHSAREGRPCLPPSWLRRSLSVLGRVCGPSARRGPHGSPPSRGAMALSLGATPSRALHTRAAPHPAPGTAGIQAAWQSKGPGLGLRAGWKGLGAGHLGGGDPSASHSAQSSSGSPRKCGRRKWLLRASPPQGACRSAVRPGSPYLQAALTAKPLPTFPAASGASWSLRGICSLTAKCSETGKFRPQLTFWCTTCTTVPAPAVGEPQGETGGRWYRTQPEGYRAKGLGSTLPVALGPGHPGLALPVLGEPFESRSPVSHG